MTDEERLRRFADLVVRIGANVQQGQDVFLSADVGHVPIARAVAAAAYRAGARRVVVDYSDPHVRRSAIVDGPEDGLRLSYGWEVAWFNELRELGAAMILLAGNPEPNVLAGLDPARVAIRRPEVDEALNRTIFDDRVMWTIAPAPNPGWAGQVFGDPDVERLWTAVSTAIRLDEPDPVEAWRQHLTLLRTRRDALNALDLDAVRFRGPGTDLHVGLIRGSVWAAGSMTTPDGVEYVPNMPTEEVFTSPDFRRTEGTVRTTAPLVHNETLVTGLRLRFDGGRIVEVDADAGAEMIRAELDEDAQARYLGEVALVDGGSAVAKAGVVFHNTLFDENANSHIAWGRGFEETVPGSASLDHEGRLALGLNDSRIHTDIVIGGPEVVVDGIGRDGRVTPLIRDDRLVLEV